MATQLAREVDTDEFAFLALLEAAEHDGDVEVCTLCMDAVHRHYERYPASHNEVLRVATTLASKFKAFSVTYPAMEIVLKESQPDDIDATNVLIQHVADYPFNDDMSANSQQQRHIRLRLADSIDNAEVYESLVGLMKSGTVAEREAISGIIGQASRSAARTQEVVRDSSETPVSVDRRYVIVQEKDRTEAADLLEKLHHALMTLQDLGLDDAQTRILEEVILPALQSLRAHVIGREPSPNAARTTRARALTEVGQVLGGTNALNAIAATVTIGATAPQAFANFTTAAEGLFRIANILTS